MNKEKAFVGLTFKARRQTAWRLIKFSLRLMYKAFDTEWEYAQAVKMLQREASGFIRALAPTKETLRKEVEKRPFEPFGIPGWTDTFTERPKVREEKVS